jgi:hypothetical protein
MVKMVAFGTVAKMVFPFVTGFFYGPVKKVSGFFYLRPYFG